MLVVPLNVEVSGDLLQCREDFKSVGVDFDEAWPKGKVRVDLLVPGEGLIEDLQRALDDSTVLVVVDVARVHDAVTRTGLRTGPVALHALAVLRHFVRRARPHTGSIVLEQVLGAMLHARCTVSEFSVWIRLPQVVGWVVDLHGWAFLLAFAVVVEVFTS